MATITKEYCQKCKQELDRCVCNMGGTERDLHLKLYALEDFVRYNANNYSKNRELLRVRLDFQHPHFKDSSGMAILNTSDPEISAAVREVLIEEVKNQLIRVKKELNEFKST